MRVRDVVIRTYEPRDQDRLWELHEEGLRDTGTLIGEYHKEMHPDLAAIEDWYPCRGGDFWVAAVRDGLVGMVGIEQIDNATGRLRQMRVAGPWRRRGVGQALLDTAERFCHTRGYRRLVLETTALQTAAHHLYEHSGFTRIGERKVSPFTVFDYEKVLV